MPAAHPAEEKDPPKTLHHVSCPSRQKTETLPLYPASCRLPIWEDERPLELESESDVSSAFRETVGRTLLRLQGDTGISWLIQAPSCIIQEGVSFSRLSREEAPQPASQLGHLEPWGNA